MGTVFNSMSWVGPGGRASVLLTSSCRPFAIDRLGHISWPKKKKIKRERERDVEEEVVTNREGWKKYIQ